MKKSKQETAETRNRILEIAARELRLHGITGFGIANLMSLANLTHGGFYRHFDSKDQLVREALSLSMNRIIDTMKKEGAPKTKVIAQIADQYLSDEHLIDSADGCPFAALGSDVARAETETRRQATEGFEELIVQIAKQLGDPTDEDVKNKALISFCSMVGALTMARMVSDPSLAETILTQMKHHLGEI